MANVSESQLVTRLGEILHSCDHDTTTTNIICRLLEAEFPPEFINSRKELIRQQIELFVDVLVVEQEVKEGSQNEVVLEEERESEENKQVEDPQGRKRRKSESADKGSDLKKKRPGGFCRPCGLSPQLQGFLGVHELPKTEVVQRIWSYIREKNLQYPEDKRKIICDEPLFRIFGVESINMFEMNKALSKHVWSLNEATDMKSPQKERQSKKSKDVAASSSQSSQKERGQKQRKESDDPKEKEKPERPTASNITVPLPLSDALIEFFGTGERELSRAQAIKKIWEHIKENKLQDPSDRKLVLCDEKLKELFKVDSFGFSNVSKLLTSHLIKPKK